MRFWDSSALVPLCVEEPATKPLLALARAGDPMIVWWASLTECDSALARLERDGALSRDGVDAAFRRLDVLKRAWIEIEPRDEIREIARRLLRLHPLRAADATQLAAAHLAAERRPATLEVVTLDDRLHAAAAKEGFLIADVPESS
jgi:predicted nucleic acid-binding protein